MNKPTCETCPFWEKKTTPLDSLPLSMRGRARAAGRCRVHSPKKCGMCGSESWPVTGDVDFCGEHPDFKAYVDELKKPLIEKTARCDSFFPWTLADDEIGMRCELPSGHQGEHKYAHVGSRCRETCSLGRCTLWSGHDGIHDFKQF